MFWINQKEVDAKIVKLQLKEVTQMAQQEEK
jgi:hypothetical protein